MPRDGAGMGAALSAIGVEGRLEDDATQEDLFASSPLLGSDQAGELKPVKRGRPPGALNITTEAWKSFWLTHYRSPLLWLGDLITADPFKLLDAIRAADAEREDVRAVSLLDVLALQKSAAEAVAPYVHRKQPIAIDAGEDAKVPLFMQVLLDPASLQSAIAQRTENAGETPAYTPVDESEVAPEKSHQVDDARASD